MCKVSIQAYKSFDCTALLREREVVQFWSYVLCTVSHQTHTKPTNIFMKSPVDTAEGMWRHDNDGSAADPILN